MKESAGTVENFMLPVASFNITGLVVGLGRHIYGGTYRSLEARQQHPDSH